MRDRWILGVLALMLTACAAPALVPTPTPADSYATPEQFQLAYPESLEPLVRALVSGYQQARPNVRIVLVERADDLAWPLLERGEVELAALAMSLPDDPSAELWTTVFARDGLAVVVNPQNGVPGLTAAQLRELFVGRVADWEPLGGLPGLPQLLTRDDASGDQRFFQTAVMEASPVALTALLLPTTESVLEKVAGEPLSVGYVSSARVDARVRALAIEGMPPAKELLASGGYPLTRELYLAAGEAPQGAVYDFVQWVLGAPGQTVIERQGWVPAPAETP